MKTSILFATIMAAITTPAPTALELPIFETRNVALSGLWHVYAPATAKTELSDLLLVGGWLSEAETGNDRIHVYRRLADDRTERTATFARPGTSVNDPSVVVHPRHGWLMMYYTSLDERNATAERMQLRNHVGLATSTDDGVSWTDHGVVIGQDNGENDHGAWAPSAVLSPDGAEIWLYYHTNSPSNITLRTRFTLEGWRRIGETERVVFGSGTTGIGQIQSISDQSGRVNVDVAHLPRRNAFILVANEHSLSRVSAFMSTDGLHFERLGDRPIIDAGDGQALAPHVRALDKDRIAVSFGAGSAAGRCSRWWHAHGVPEMRCSSSIEEWRFSLPE